MDIDFTMDDTIKIHHTISAATVVKVVVVGTVAAYFARNFVRVIDETITHGIPYYREKYDEQVKKEEKK